jgi:hypothetical protein
MSKASSGESPERNRLRQLREELRHAIPHDRSTTVPVDKLLSAKAALFAEFLVSRISDCSQATVSIGETGSIIPSLMLSRTVAETVIMLYWLWLKIEEFLRTNDRLALDRFITSGHYGPANSTSVDHACDLLMSIGRLDRECRGFKEQFNRLCEYTDMHYGAATNLLGMIGPGGSPESQDRDADSISRAVTSEILSSCIPLTERFAHRIAERLCYPDVNETASQQEPVM